MRSSDAIVGYKGLAHSPPTLKCQFWQVALSLAAEQRFEFNAPGVVDQPPAPAQVLMRGEPSRKLHRFDIREDALKPR